MRLLMTVAAAALLTAAGTSGVAGGREAADGERPESSTLRPLVQIGDFPDWATSVAISPDGETLAAGSYDVVKLWSLSRREPVGELKTRKGFVHGLAFSPDGKTLAAGGYQVVQLWDVADHKNRRTLSGHKGYVRALAFSPRGPQLASACEDRTVKLWDAETGMELRTIGPLEYPALSVAWSPDGELLATAEGDETRLTRPGLVKIWSPQTLELLHSLPSHEMAATGVAFTADGKTLLSTSYDEHVNLYNVETGEPIGFYGGHSRPTNCVIAGAHGQFAVSGSGGRFKGKNEIKVFNPKDGNELGSIDAHEGKVTSLALSPDGRFLASASQDKTVAVWDLSPLTSPVEVERSAQAPINLVAAVDDQPDEKGTMKIGIIGLDTSHAVAFTKALNAENPAEALAGCKIVTAYPKGSPDIESSTSRVPGYTEEVKKLGVEIVDSIDELVQRVDAVLLETNDGRPHLEQVLPALKAGKPVFIDKPIAGSLSDAIAIMEASRHYKTPVFSASSLRFLGQAREVRNGSAGKVVGCDTFSPCSLEPTHPDLFWYGIHGVESLFTVMGTGCKTVSRASTDDFDLVTGTWEDGRIGTFRGLRAGQRGYGGVAYCEKKIVTLGPYPGYQPLIESIVHFFRTGEAPVTTEETLEIYAFMEAADESKRQGGKPVEMRAVIDAARAKADETLKRMIPDFPGIE
jgi:WD40 repeat protein/predicted dehydrogenase